MEMSTPKQSRAYTKNHSITWFEITVFKLKFMYWMRLRFVWSYICYVSWYRFIFNKLRLHKIRKGKILLYLLYNVLFNIVLFIIQILTLRKTKQHLFLWINLAFYFHFQLSSTLKEWNLISFWEFIYRTFLELLSNYLNAFSKNFSFTSSLF